jgi:hypothetical protein
MGVVCSGGEGYVIVYDVVGEVKNISIVKICVEEL